MQLLLAYQMIMSHLLLLQMAQYRPIQGLERIFQFMKELQNFLSVQLPHSQMELGQLAHLVQELQKVLDQQQ